jgi:DNA-binding MarR family transcriptional regulator
MKPPDELQALRTRRNRALYRSTARILREYNRRLIAELHVRGFTDFSPAFPQFLSNLDTQGTRIGVIAARAGVTRQAAGKLLNEIERCGYAERRSDPADSRATLVTFTARGRRMLATVIDFLEARDREFAAELGKTEYERLRLGLFRVAELFDPEPVLGDGED